MDWSDLRQRPGKTNYNRYMLFQWDGTSFVKKISLKKTQQEMDTWTGAEQMRDFLRVTVFMCFMWNGMIFHLFRMI